MRKGEFERLSVAFVQAKREESDAKARAAELQERLLEILPSDRVVVDLGNGDTATLTRVAPVRVTWMAVQVKKLLPVRLWNRVKVEVVDKAILEAMIASGELAGYDLSSAKEVAESRPYLRLTEKPRNAVVVSISKGQTA